MAGAFIHATGLPALRQRQGRSQTCDAAACNSLLETLTGACSTLRLLGAFTLGGIDQQ